MFTPAEFKEFLERAILSPSAFLDPGDEGLIAEEALDG